MNTLDQHRIFAFYVITKNSIQRFFFEWKEPNHPLHMQLLNTICGLEFIREWRDNRYDFVTGKAIIMTEDIRKKIEKLKVDFIQQGENQHKKIICDLSNTFSSLTEGDTFFIYRLAFSFPTQPTLFRIKNELDFIQSGKTKDEADEWYDKNVALFFNEYEIAEYINIKQGEAEKSKKVCRFCHRKFPEVTFKKIAHAIPESIGGNKNLVCNEECDECNELFGVRVESNLCNWFDFRRSQFGVIRKHGGIPKAYGRNYIIENQNINVFPDSKIDGKFKAIGSGIITEQGIYRALCKIAIDLIESKYLARLHITTDWIRLGTPKSSKYPQIAQMCKLEKIEEPHLYIISRKDGLDRDNAPLHFCILRIFDLAFLYALPHVDGRMIFKPSYMDSINTEALKVLGLNQEWVWESYDSTEKRNPHVLLDLKNSIKPSTSIGDGANSSKLRKETKPTDSVDFDTPFISDENVIKHEITNFDYKGNIEANEFIQTIGNISAECKFDLDADIPLSLQLIITFDNVVNMKRYTNIVYCTTFDNRIYVNQFKYSKSTIAVNQILIAKVLELSLKYLFIDISKLHPNLPFVEDSLSINNASELLKNMKIEFVTDGISIHSANGSDLWYSGYQ